MRVTFADRRKTHIFYMPDEEERSDIWWSDTDYYRFRAHAEYTVDAARKNESIGDSHSLRGLESFSRQNAQERRENVRSAIDLVLREQDDISTEMGYADFFSFAEKYSAQTADSREKALALAIQDEEDVLSDCESGPQKVREENDSISTRAKKLSGKSRTKGGFLRSKALGSLFFSVGGLRKKRSTPSAA